MNEMISRAGRCNCVRWSVLIAGLAVLIGLLWYVIIAHRGSAAGRESVTTLPPSGLVSWWPGEGDGNDAVGANNGVVPDSVTFAEGKVGRAFSFALGNRECRDFDEIHIPRFAWKLPTSEITVEFWQKVDSVRSQYSLITSGRTDANLFTVSAPWRDGKIYFEFGSPNSLSYLPPVSIVGTWQHLACVASQTGDFMKIYRNGALEAQRIGMTPFANSMSDLRLGYCITGLLDEVRIYNRALSASEILFIYNANSTNIAGAK